MRLTIDYLEEISRSNDIDNLSEFLKNISGLYNTYIRFFRYHLRNDLGIDISTDVLKNFPISKLLSLRTIFKRDGLVGVLRDEDIRKHLVEYQEPKEELNSIEEDDIEGLDFSHYDIADDYLALAYSFSHNPGGGRPLEHSVGAGIIKGFSLLDPDKYY